MDASVRFSKDVLGLEIVYGGERSYFTSLRTKDGDTILNLEHGNAGIQWGRLIFHVSDVDRFRAYLMEKAFIHTTHTMPRGAKVIFICSGLDSPVCSLWDTCRSDYFSEFVRESSA
jgi:hypothetical protein